MVRPREFDSNAALDLFLQAFWEQGYAATSVDDLCSRSGLSKSSVYSAFGDKHALLCLSLERYIEIRIGHIRELFKKTPDIHLALGAMGSEIIDAIEGGPGRRGCFIGNCAAEIENGDRATMMLIAKGLAEMEAIFAKALKLARRRGELSNDVSIEATARFLVAGFQGLRLIGKVTSERKALQDIVDVILSTVKKPVNPVRFNRGKANV